MRERERMSMSGEGTEKEGDTESETGSRLWAVSTEPYAGLEPMNREIMTWAKIGCSTNWATQAPLEYILLILIHSTDTYWGSPVCHMYSRGWGWYSSTQNWSSPCPQTTYNPVGERKETRGKETQKYVIQYKVVTVSLKTMKKGKRLVSEGWDCVYMFDVCVCVCLCEYVWDKGTTSLRRSELEEWTMWLSEGRVKFLCSWEMFGWC